MGRRNGTAGERRGIAKRMAHAAPEKRAGEAAKLFGEVVAEYLADKAPGWIAFLEEVPLTPSQKIQRGQLRELARSLPGMACCIDTRTMKKRQ